MLYNLFLIFFTAEWIWRPWQRHWWDITVLWTSCSADNFTYCQFLLKKNIRCFSVLPCAFIDLSIVGLYRVKIFFYSSSCFVFCFSNNSITQKTNVKVIGKNIMLHCILFLSRIFKCTAEEKHEARRQLSMQFGFFFF